MITYEKRFGTWNLLSRLYGAPWPRAFILSFPSTLLAVLLAVFAPGFVNSNFTNPAAYSAFAGLVTFGLIFRTNLSYSRYWEACTAIRTMSSKWSDIAIQVLSYDEGSENSNVKGGLRFRSEFLHSLSLMHGLALQRLRGDSDLLNIATGSLVQTPKLPPPMDAAEDPFWMSLRLTKRLFILRSDSEHFSDYWKATPLAVIGGISPSECDVLEEVQDRVYTVMCWILRMIVSRRNAGGIRCEPPIVNRVYQGLSDGMLGFENALKIVTVPFPFPFAQSIAILLHINAVLTPLVLARWAGPVWLVGVLTFLTVFAFYLLNDVAQEIEEPFRYDPNDLPLAYHQFTFNDRLVTALVKSLMPVSPSTFFSHIGEEESIMRQVAMSRPSAQRKRSNVVEVVQGMSGSNVSGRVAPEPVVEEHADAVAPHHSQDPRGQEMVPQHSQDSKGHLQRSFTDDDAASARKIE